MLKLTNSNGCTVYLPPQLVHSITEAGTSSQWHGIRSIVKTIHGQTHECQETAGELRAAWELAMKE
jgi:hypothetical protein